MTLYRPSNGSGGIIRVGGALARHVDCCCAGGQSCADLFSLSSVEIQPGSFGSSDMTYDSCCNAVSGTKTLSNTAPGVYDWVGPTAHSCCDPEPCNNNGSVCNNYVLWTAYPCWSSGCESCSAGYILWAVRYKATVWTVVGGCYVSCQEVVYFSDCLELGVDDILGTTLSMHISSTSGGPGGCYGWPCLHNPTGTYCNLPTSFNLVIPSS
jgi:hypothetical protein